MNPDRKSLNGGAIGTLVVLLLIAFITFRHHIYAPGARQLQQYLALRNNFGNPYFSTYAFGTFVWIALRKIYGTVTFTIVAFFLSATFARPVRFRNTVIVLTIVRALLEVLERLLHRGDTIAESLFDTMTGTLAGAIGAVAYSARAEKSEVA